MKKFPLLLALVLVAAMLAGCAGTPVVYNCTCPTAGETAPAAPETTQPALPAPEGALKTGLALVTSVSDSTSATADAAGQAKYDVTMVAVLVDEAGVIQDCIIDGVATSVGFDAAGAITTDIAAPVSTKNELGEAYGMKAYGGAVAEWDQQAQALADQPALPAPEGALKTGLALVTSVSDSTSATADAAGQAKYDVTMVAVLVDEAGVIQDCIIDGVATSVGFDAAGAITTDIAAPVSTKNELGEAYGMKAYGGAVAEWDQQAQALADFAVGKTVQELKEGAIDESGKAPAGSDLATSATIYLGGYVSAIEVAAANAQHLGAQAGDTLRLCFRH